MIRAATAADEAAIVALHWLSWRTHYRAILPAPFIDTGLGAELARQWRERFAQNPTPSLILVEEDEHGLGGFVAGFAEAGTLFVDNLHAAPDRLRQGIGPSLLAEVARRGMAQGLRGLYLWVFDANTQAQRFYRRIGGVPTARQVEEVFGHPAADTRFDWPDLEVLAGLAPASMQRS